MDKRNNTNLLGKEIPYIEKFLVPQRYEIFRFGGSSVKDDKKGIQKMLRYFSDYFTEEQLKENMRHYNLQRMFDLVKKYFKKEYNFDGQAIALTNRY